jgi:phosphopantetheinyl transferase
MYWPSFSNTELQKQECHIWVMALNEPISNKSQDKAGRQQLIKSILEKYTKQTFEIETTGPGKPYLNTKEIHFNVSHSKNILVLAISHFPVGIDVEFVKKKDFKRFSEYFWHKDITYNYHKSFQALVFFQAWTQTEAWVKYHGETIFTHQEFHPTQLLTREIITHTNCKMVSFMPMVNCIATLCCNPHINTIKLKHHVCI